MPRLAGIVDLTDDLRAEIDLSQSIGANVGKFFKNRSVKKEKMLDQKLQGVLARSALYAAQNKLDPGQTLDLLLKTDPQAKAELTRDFIKTIHSEIIRGQRQQSQAVDLQSQEKDLMARLDKSMTLRDRYAKANGGIVPGREREYDFFDKQVKDTLDILQGGGTPQQPQQPQQPQGTAADVRGRINNYMQQTPELQGMPTIAGKPTNKSLADVASSAGGYMQQAPELQGEMTIRDKPPADFAKLFEDVERTLAMGKGATPEPGGSEKAGFTQAQTAGQTPAEFYKYFDKLDDVSRQQLMQILQGSDENMKKIALERLRKTYGTVR